MEFAAHGINLVPWYHRLLRKVKLMVLPTCAEYEQYKLNLAVFSKRKFHLLGNITSDGVNATIQRNF